MTACVAGAVASREALELLPRQAQARVGGVHADAEDLRDLRHRKLLELGQDEHLALLFVEAVEHPLQEERPLAKRDDLVGAQRRRGERINVGRRLARTLVRALALHRSPVVPDDVEDDPGEPGAHRRAPLELREPALGDDEDLLNDVIDRPLADPERPRAPPDEAEMGAVDLLERGNRRGRERALGDAHRFSRWHGAKLHTMTVPTAMSIRQKKRYSTPKKARPAI